MDNATEIKVAGASHQGIEPFLTNHPQDFEMNNPTNEKPSNFPAKTNGKLPKPRFVIVDSNPEVEARFEALKVCAALRGIEVTRVPGVNDLVMYLLIGHKFGDACEDLDAVEKSLDCNDKV